MSAQYAATSFEARVAHGDDVLSGLEAAALTAKRSKAGKLWPIILSSVVLVF
jgi:hypothetical protein